MDITVKTTYSLDTFKALNRLISFRGRRPSGRLILAGVSLLVIAASSAFLISYDSEMLRPCLFLFGIYIFCAAVILFQVFGLPRMQLKQMQKLGLPDIVYTFGSESVTAVSTSQNGSGTTELKYSALHKAVETNAYFFLYQTVNQVLIVEKSGIQNGSCEDIAARLKGHLGRRFKKNKRM